MESFEWKAQNFGLFRVLNQSYGMIKGEKVRVAMHCVNSRKRIQEEADAPEFHRLC